MSARDFSVARIYGVSGEQELLLQAALLPGEQALQAWRTWRASGDLEVLEPGTYAILPRLYWNLERLGIDDPLLSILKGIYKRTWFVNQMASKSFAEIARALAARGVAALPLGGLAAMLTVHEDPGLRPLSGLALAVPPRQLQDAAQALRDLGHTPQNRVSDALRYGNPLFVPLPGDLNLELRWQLLPHLGVSPADNRFWPQTRAASFADLRYEAMQPADALFYALTGGSRWDAPEPLVWIVDAACMIQKGEVDWQRLLELAKSMLTRTALKTALLYIGDLLSPLIPAELLQRLKTLPIPARDRIYYRAYWLPPAEGGAGMGFKAVFQDKVRFHKGRPLWFVCLTALRQYARNRLGLSGPARTS